MARKLRSDEFEARQRQLPATNKRNIGGKSLAGSREDLARTPLGSPPVDYDVRSIFDVRPVGAFDFNIESSEDLVSETPPFPLIEFSVPEGFVCVLRDISIWFEENPESETALKSDLKWSLTLNGADYPYNQLNSFGSAVDRELVYLLADEFNRVGVRITAGSLVFLDDTCFVRFHGTFLLKTSRPLPFEIANPTARKQVRATRAPSAPPSKQKEPPVLAQPTSRPTPPGSTEMTQLPKSSPDFVVNWAASGAGNTMMLKPMQNDKGQRRVLTRDEMIRFKTFLLTIPMNQRDAELRANYFKSIGV